jgi:membrane-associated phospholipid phosphatase
METLLDIGVQMILVLQNLGDWIVPVMQGFSYMGVEDFYLIVLPTIYWCFNPGFGLRLSLIVMLSGSVNDSLKVLFHTPRPYWVSQEIKAHFHEYQFGLPSGHAQHAVAFWGYWARQVKKRWFWLVAIFLMILIGISRLVLGMHFYFDVIVGWVVGIIFLWVFIRLEPRVSAWLKSKNPPFQMTAIFFVSLALIGLFALSIAALGDWQIPTIWLENSKAQLGEELSRPYSYRGIVAKAGVICGLGIGAVLIQARGGFKVAGSNKQKLGRYLVGIIGAGVFWIGLKSIFPEGETLIPMIFRYLRYWLTGFWVAAAAPLVFKRLKLIS